MSQRPERVGLALTSNLQHTLIDNDLFTIVNGKPTGFPKIPPRYGHDPTPRSESLSRITRPLWLTDSMPYLAFVPAQDPFKTEWLEPLDYTEETMPVVADITPGAGGMFVLDSVVIQLWEDLERVLRRLLRASMKLANIGIPNDFRFWSYPTQYGYTRPHYSELTTRRHAVASRNAFLPLAGAISYFVHCMKMQEEVRDSQSRRDLPQGLSDEGLEEQHWRQVLDRLQKETGLSSIWLSYWRKSLLGATHVGAFVDTTSLKYLVPVLIKAKLPLALYWGDARESWYHAPSLTTWAPSTAVLNRLVLIRYGSARLFAPDAEIGMLDDEVRRAQSGRHGSTVIEGRLYEILTRALDREQSTRRADRGPTSDPLLAIAPQSRKNPVLPNSGQRPDEDINAFFERREQEKASRIARESAVDRQRRLQRESVAAKDLPPGRKGATVFYWELVDGVRRRMPAGRNHYESYWEEYGPHQRRYDSVRNEWDVCTDFDPDDSPPYCSDDEEADEPASEVLPDEQDNLDLEGGGTSAEYLRHLHGEAEPTSTHPPLEFPDPFEDIAYHRLGWLDHINVITHPEKDVHWDKVRNVLGNARSEQAPQLRKSNCDILRHFITALLAANRLADAPKNLDLHYEGAEIHGNWGFSVIYKDIKDGFYLISPDSANRGPFQLALKSAGAVLEIVRRGWGPDPTKVIPNLMRHGIAFNTFIRDTPRLRVAPGDSWPRPLLGYRDQKFLREGSVDAGPQQVLKEYRAYVYQRDHFLRMERGRAAILAGGIIARLALHIVNEDALLKGPTKKVWSSGECLWDGHSDSAGYWDDLLTEEEIDLICGVYDVGTGQRDRRGYMQVAQKSWWPRPTAWKVSGLNCGYWTRDAEAWFQRRLKSISNGSAMVLSNEEWKQSIKFTKDAFRLAKRTENLAHEYLQRRIMEGQDNCL